MYFTREQELLLLGVGSVTFLLTALINRKLPSYFKIRKDIKSMDENYYHTFFTTIENADCREHLNSREACSDRCSYMLLQKICKFLASANSSISLCVFTACIESVYEELVAAHKRGVVVRLITDCEMKNTNMNIFNALQGTAMKPRTQGCHLTGMMHHKFCLVDEKDSTRAKLFFGSLNLTLQGVAGNFEHVLFTNDRHFVDRFSEEFEYLWAKFK